MKITSARTSLLLLSAALMSAAGLGFAKASSVSSASGPDQSLKTLMDGNARYIKGDAVSHNLPAARKGLAAGQAPFAAVVRCADSRVAPEIVFDQPLGELFVCAIAGNVPTTAVIASLEYAVAVLGSDLIVVMGHSACGAVDAAITHRADPAALPGNLPGLIDTIIVPCTMNSNPDDPKALPAAISCNAQEGLRRIMAQSTVISRAVTKGDVRIVAGVQDLGTGKFSLVGDSKKR